jgi:hypothetical protein
MGSYSWTDYCEIKVQPGKREAFQNYLIELEKKELPDWIEYGKEHAKVITLEDDDVVDISIDQWKIITYWYDNTILFFDELSQYLEGELYLSFESPSEYAIIHFSTEGTTYEIGTMKYDTYTGDEMRESTRKLKEWSDKVWAERNKESEE